MQVDGPVPQRGDGGVDVAHLRDWGDRPGPGGEQQCAGAAVGHGRQHFAYGGDRGVQVELQLRLDVLDRDFGRPGHLQSVDWGVRGG